MRKWKDTNYRARIKSAAPDLINSVEALEARTLLSGVTLITHGFGGAGDADPPSGNSPGGWAYEMAEAIGATPGVYPAIYKITATDNGTGGGPISISAPQALDGYTPNSSPNPQIILLLDWSALAGDFSFSSIIGTITGTNDVRSTVDVAQAVATALLTPDFVPGIPSLAALPFDLIGHSRGGSLVAQLADDLGQSGVWVDQVTTLDPHPVDGGLASFDFNFGDSIPQHWSNITFFDNYWENGGGALLQIAGQPVAGAFNVQLNDSILDSAGYPNHLVTNIGDHGDTHLWYQGTVDPSAGIPDDGSATGGSNWYETADGMGPQTGTGYYFSLVDGGNRAALAPQGLSESFGGSAVTVPVTTSGPQWPDIGNIQLIGGSTNNVVIGTSLNVSYYIQTPDSDATLTWYANTNQNPFDDSNAVQLQPTALVKNTQGAIRETSGSRFVATSNLSTGEYYVYAEIEDGGLYRYAYLPGQFTFAIGPASKVVISTEPPATATAGSAFNVVARIEDANGNLVTTDDSDVTLAIASGPSGAVLNGTTTVAAVSGVATFPGITLDTAGTYTLSATDTSDGIGPFASGTYTVSPAAASRLVFASVPSSVAAGSTFSSNVVVKIKDAFGNLENGDDANIAITVASGPGSLAGTTSVNASGGVATFSNLSLQTLGTYTLQATDASDSLSVTSGLTVAPGSPTRVVFIQQPTNAPEGSPINPNVQVGIEDQFGNVVTTDDANVTLKGLTLPTGVTFPFTTVAADNGIATFSSITFNTPGGYRFKAVTAGIPNVQSAKFYIGGPTQIVFTQQPTEFTTSGFAMSPDFIAAVEDQFNQVITSYHSAVTLKPLTEPSNVSIPFQTVDAVNGIATFTPVTENVAGGYRFKVVTGGLPNTHSNKLYVVAVVASEAAFANESNDTPVDPTDAILDGIFTFAANDGTTTINDLLLSQTGNE